MYLLYLDSASGADTDKHFVLGGIAVFERSLFHVIRRLDELVGNAAELAGEPLAAAGREALIGQALGTLHANSKGLRLFGIAVDRDYAGERDPVALAVDELGDRFNLYLQRLYKQNEGNPEFQHRGLAIFEQAGAAGPHARTLRMGSSEWGRLRNLAEVPLFVEARASRLMQLADLVAFALLRRYEHQDGRFFDPIVPLFDSEGSALHGLVHYHPRSQPCDCPACRSRSR